MDIDMDVVDNDIGPPGVNNNVAAGVDATDIIVSPIIPHHRTLGEGTSSNGNESSDSKKFWDRFIKKKSKEPGGDELIGPLASCHALAFEYNMNHLRRGRAIIFNHNKFHPHQQLSERPGSDVDSSTLKTTFEGLGFRVDVYHDLAHAKIESILEQASLENHTDSDCIAVVVMSHGRFNELHAYDIAYKPDSIWNHFTADKCSTLAGKPKIFFIQACRGEQYDDGTMLTSPRSRTAVDGPSDGKAFRIPNQADFLTVFSTAPALAAMPVKINHTFVTRVFQYLSLSTAGYFSWRNSRTGACFVQALCRILNEFAFKLDLLSMITMVNCEVAINYQSNVPRDVTQHQKKQVPHVSHTLTRQIQFAQKPFSTLV